MVKGSLNDEVVASAIPLFAGATIRRLTMIIIRLDAATRRFHDDDLHIPRHDEAFRGVAGGCSQFAYLYKYRYRRYGLRYLRREMFLGVRYTRVCIVGIHNA